jgi:hypothetical protein
MIDAYEIADADRLIARAAAEPHRAAQIRYLAEFLRSGPRGLIDAADLPRLVLAVDDELVPVVINNGEEAQCYLLSPHVHYVAYMQEELRKIRGNRAARLMSAAVSAIGCAAAPLGFNRCVSVNNWLFTSSPTPALAFPALQQLTHWLIARFPDLPLVFRGVDPRSNQIGHIFERVGYLLVIHRPVFELAAKQLADLPSRQRRNVALDLALLEDPRFTITYGDKLAPGEEARVASLYRRLYVEKHSRYNARFTPAYFRAVADLDVEQVLTLRAGGEILAFGTLRPERERLVFALIGYDLEKQSQGMPLYRAIFGAAIRTAFDSPKPLFLSTGNAQFKKHRGGVESLEYEAVYQGHLPAARRLPWRLFKATLDRMVRDLDTQQI